MFKFSLQEEQVADKEQKLTYMVTIDEVSSSDPKVIAAALRAIAERLDPIRLD